jgi:hypothetical protein
MVETNRAVLDGRQAAYGRDIVLRYPRMAQCPVSLPNKNSSRAFPSLCSSCNMIKIRMFVIGAVVIGITSLCSAQTTSPTTASGGTTIRSSNAPYIEGPVWTLTMVKTKAGLEDDYLRQISGTVKPVYEEEKKQKIILDYKILQGDAMGTQDYNIIIMIQYPNMAALDGLRDKMDPILEKVMGSEDQRRATAVKRLDIREILGTKTMREITLK